ncbi:MAG TPA: ATP-binding cassette domain-containing protein, partial [Chloroflexota bacterium]|nr:ATP-binding cassette domain-containing protein [Chloroflexota bacterium]
DGGRALVEGHDVVRQADKVRSLIGLTGQYAAVDELLTGMANLTMIGRLYRLSAADSRRRATDLLEVFDLTNAAARPVKTYSGGMRRRLDLAASLIANPPILYLDEPTTGLDPHSRNAMWEIIRQLVREGTTILLTTQYLEEADQLADQIAVIDTGTVVAKGSPDDLKRQLGGERFDIVTGNSAAFEQAVLLLGARALQADRDNWTLSLRADEGFQKLYDTLGELQRVGIEIAGFSLHRPTLDDVFLRLTQRATGNDLKGGE